MLSHAFTRRAVAAICVLGITACSGLHQAMPPVAAGSGDPAAAASFLGLPFAKPAAATNATTLFVGNLCSASAINVFPINATGNVPPSRTIVGSNTTLNGTTGLSIDGDRLWATKSEDANNSAVLGFSVDSEGNVAPQIKITGVSPLWSASAVVQDPASKDIYVTDSYNNRVVVFAGNSNGAATPLRIIKGASTLLAKPAGIFLAPSSRIGVVNSANKSIAFFARTAHGNVAPVARIAGTATGLSQPFSAAYFGGNLYVTNAAVASSVLVFAAGANGNVAPIHTISGGATQLSGPIQLGIDSIGNVYVANYAPPVNEVTVFRAGSFGNIAPIQLISGSNTGFLNNCPEGLAVGHVAQLYVPGPYPEGAAVAAFKLTATGYDLWFTELTGSAPPLANPRNQAFDAGGHMFVVDRSLNAVFEYASGADGMAAPIAKIQGAATHLSSPNAIGLDKSGDIYVSNTNSAVTVYAANSNGNVAPTRTISGAATHIIGAAEEISVKPSGEFYVVSSGGNNILNFAAGQTGNVAPSHEIVGAATGISNPVALAVIGTNRIYEANASGSVIREFPGSGTGNIAPASTITGTFNSPTGLALDPNNDLFVSDCGSNAVYVYAHSASGSTPPIRELGGADHRFSCPGIPTVY
jgi:NHL repeat